MRTKLTHEEFLERLFKVKKENEFKVLGKYSLQQVPIKFKHTLCGCEFYATPNNMCKKSYGGCPNCGKEKRIFTKRKNSPINLDVVKKKLKELYPDNRYTIDEEKSSYINNKIPSIFLKCKKCSNIFKISYVNLCKERGCPICNKIALQESKNIKKIKSFLKENNIEYKCEHSIPDCKNIRVLKFDIAIIKDDKKILFIEYDGEFHDFGYNNNKESLEKIKKNDSIKDEYCKKHNIPLLRLRYNSFNNYQNDIKNFLNLV